jgi:RNA polymerase sigma factor (sigma-70 family)
MKPTHPNQAEPFLPTRSSLLSQLRDPADDAAWRAFTADYGRLIHQVCLRAGLQHQEAEDIHQETLIAVANQMPRFQYDRGKGPFKGWLARVTRNHIADYLTKKTREARKLALAANAESPNHENNLEAAWEAEWQQHLLQRALARVREKVSPRNLQIFQMASTEGWTTEEIVKALGVNRAQVYLSKLRVGRLFAKEITALKEELE